MACWNCGSDDYVNADAVEECAKCGIKCDYWGGGANDAYDRASRRREDEDDDLPS